MATDIARRMVTEWGMSEKLGPLPTARRARRSSWATRSPSTRTCPTPRPLRSTAEVRRIVDTAYATARKVLTENLDQLHTLAKGLLEYETLSGDEINALLRGEPISAPTSRTRRRPLSSRRRTTGVGSDQRQQGLRWSSRNRSRERKDRSIMAPAVWSRQRARITPGLLLVGGTWIGRGGLHPPAGIPGGRDSGRSRGRYGPPACRRSAGFRHGGSDRPSPGRPIARASGPWRSRGLGAGPGWLDALSRPRQPFAGLALEPAGRDHGDRQRHARQFQ